MLKFILIVFICSVSALSETYYFKDDKKVFLEKLLNQSKSNYLFYKDSNDIVLGVDGKLIVKFNSLESFDNYVNEFQLILLRKLKSNLFIFKVNDVNKTLEVSNLLHEKEDIEYSNPNFLKRSIKR